MSYFVTQTSYAKTDDDYIKDYNAVARLANSSLAIMPDSQLVQLRTRRNQEVDGFPMMQGDIDRLNCESHALPCRERVR